MRTLDDGTLALSPSDLSAHLACAHLTTLSLAVARGELEQPHVDSPHRDLIFRKGNEHEHAYLARLEARRTLDPSHADVRRRGLRPRGARRADGGGDPRARGGRHLPAVPHRTAAGGGSRTSSSSTRDGGYEPVDTKLARTAKPSHVLQLCFYAEQLARIQGSPVEHVHVENGRGERETFRVAEFESYYHRVRERFLAALDAENETYPWPCDHCGICDFRRRCYAQRVEDDHLTLVAGVWRSRGEAAPGGGDRRRSKRSASSPPGTPVDGLRPETVEAMRHQAELQLRARREGRPVLGAARRSRRSAASRCSPRPTRATSGSTWRATRSSRRAAGSSTSSATATATTRAPCVYDAVWGRDRDGRAPGLRGVRRLARRATPAGIRPCTSTTTRTTSAPR